MTTPSNQIWAYLHNELPAEQKKQFEHALQNDPHLRDMFENIQLIHKQLEHLIPLLENSEMNDEELVTKLINDWEIESPEYAEPPKKALTSKLIYFALPLAAAAAAITILFSLPFGSIHWQRTIYGTAPQLRGGPTIQSSYTRSELKQISHDLQLAI